MYFDGPEIKSAKLKEARTQLDINWDSKSCTEIKWAIMTREKQCV